MRSDQERRAYARRRFTALRNLGLNDQQVRRVVDKASLSQVDTSISLYRQVVSMQMDPGSARQMFRRATESILQDGEQMLKNYGFEIPAAETKAGFGAALGGASILISLLCKKVAPQAQEENTMTAALRDAGFVASEDEGSLAAALRAAGFGQ